MRSSEAHVQPVSQFIRETDSAILIETPSGEEIWLPFSQVEKIERDAQGGGGTITMTRWIAEKKGLV